MQLLTRATLWEGEISCRVVARILWKTFCEVYRCIEPLYRSWISVFHSYPVIRVCCLLFVLSFIFLKKSCYINFLFLKFILPFIASAESTFGGSFFVL
ncbi:hypothetical protein DFS34DRAFT_603267 [Phlyctochytrium arcticum]|nr:hypothetical protein DFS34DRAFT_603267 [Phlyctochytrium arcticum]